MMALSSGADSVELKLTVPDVTTASAVAALGLDPLDAQIRQVFFFDTPDLALNQAGVVVRARRVQGRERRLGGQAAAGRARRSARASCASSPDFGRRGRRDAGRLRVLGVDEGARSARRTCAGSASRGKRPIRKLFSKEQRAFYAAHAPEGLGSTTCRCSARSSCSSSSSRRPSFARKIVAELWLYPDGSRILELSTKCVPGRCSRSRPRCAGSWPPGHRPLGRAADEDQDGAPAVLPKSRHWLRVPPPGQ